MKRHIFVSLGNLSLIESFHDRDDGRSVHCFPSELYASRSTNVNPYVNMKQRSCHGKAFVRGHRRDMYDYKKLTIHDDEKTFGLNNLRRKSLSSCDLFHMTSKTLTSPFDEIHHWLNHKRN
jgi:hypothetical protein